MPDDGCPVIVVGTETGFNNVYENEPPATVFTNAVRSVDTPPHFV